MLAKRLDKAFIKYRDQDDGRALAEVFDLIADDLFRFAAHLAKSQERAEDLVQATFLRAIERRHSYRAEGKLFSWLAGILANEWKEERRRAGRPLDFARLQQDAVPDSTNPIEDEEVRQQLREALAGVPEPYRGVLNLKYRDNLKSSAIAAQLQRPPGTVRAQISRGLELMRRLLPASLLSLFVSSLAPRLHGQVRATVLSQAGFQPVVGITGLAVAKAASIAVAAVALMSLPLVFDRSSEPELDQGSEGSAREVEPSLSPRRHELPHEESANQTEVSKTSTTEPTGLVGWRWDRSNPIAKLPDRTTKKTGQWRFSPLPAGLSWTTFRAGSAGATIQPSTVLAEAQLGALEDFPQLGEQWTYLPDGDHLAQVFYDDLRWGHLMLVPLGRRDREHQVSGASGATYESEFQVWLKERELLAEPPVAILQGREGLVRMPFHDDGKNYRLLELAPLPLEVEFLLQDGERFRVCMWKDRLKLRVFSSSASRQDRKFRLIALDSKQVVTNAAVTYLLPSTPRLSWPLPVSEAGEFTEPDVDWQQKTYAQVRVQHNDFMSQRLLLKQFLNQRDPDGRYRVYLMPKFERPGQIFDHDGGALAGAEIRVFVDHRHQEILAGYSDAEGQFSLSMPASFETHSGLGVTDFDGPVEVHVQTADGRHASFYHLKLSGLFSAPRLRLPEGPLRLNFQVQQEDGEPVAQARVSVAPAAGGDVVEDRQKVDSGTTDAEGRCQLHGVCAELVDVLVEIRGQAPLHQRLSVPADGQLAVTVPATTTIEIQFSCAAEVTDYSRVVHVSYGEVGEGRGVPQRGLVAVDASGQARFAAPYGSRFDLKISPAHQSQNTGLSYRIWPQDFAAVAAGARLKVEVMAGKLRYLDLDVGAEPLRSALIWIASDCQPDVSPWELRNEGFGGAWQERAPLNFPLGPSEFTIIAPGYRTLRARETTTPESEERLRYRLLPGPRATGVIANPDQSRSQVLNFKILAVTGVELPATYLKSLNQSWRPFCIADAEGRFESPPLIPGRYRVSMRGTTWTEIVVDMDQQEFVLTPPN